jgi:hypothetical protein
LQSSRIRAQMAKRGTEPELRGWESFGSGEYKAKAVQSVSVDDGCKRVPFDCGQLSWRRGSWHSTMEEPACLQP